MTKSIQIILDNGALDITLDQCIKHNEWFTGGCRECTVDEMERQKQDRYDEGYEAGKGAAND